MEQRQNDSVDKYFKDGLSGLNAVPDDALWGGIESGLDQPKAANTSVWRWLVVLIPAIGCASLLWFASSANNRALAMELKYNEKVELLDSLVKIIDSNVQNQQQVNSQTTAAIGVNETSDLNHELIQTDNHSESNDVWTAEDSVSPKVDSGKAKNGKNQESTNLEQRDLSVSTINFKQGSSQMGTGAKVVLKDSRNEEGRTENLKKNNPDAGAVRTAGMMRENSNGLFKGTLSLINRRPSVVLENAYQSSLLGEVQNIDFPCEGGYSTPWFIEFSPNWNFSQRIFGKGDKGAEWSNAINDNGGGIATYAESQNSVEPEVTTSIKMSEQLHSSLGFSTAIGRKVGNRFELSLGIDYYRWKMTQTNGSDVFIQTGADLSPYEVYINDGSSLFGSLGSQEIDFAGDYLSEESVNETESLQPFSYELHSNLSFISVPLKLRFNVNDVISFQTGIAYTRLIRHSQELRSFEPSEIFESRLNIRNNKSFVAAQIGVRVNALRTESFSIYFDLGDEFHLNPIYSDYYYRTFLTRSYVGVGMRYDISKKCR